MQIWNAAVTPKVGARQSLALVCLVALTAGHPVGASAADKQTIAPTVRAPAADKLKTAPTLYRHTARTAAPVLKRGVVKAAGIEWACRDKVCTASGPWPATGVKACQALAREVGRIVEYGRPGAKLAAVDLDRCNQALPAIGTLAKKVRQPTPTAGGAAAEAGSPANSSLPAGLRRRPAQLSPGAGRKTATPMTLAKGTPWLPPEEAARGPTVAMGDNCRGDRDPTDSLENPWVLAGIVAAAIAIPLATADDPDCNDVRVTESGITPPDAPGDAGGTYVISWTTDPLRNDCATWGIMVFCEIPGQPSLFPDELNIRPEDAASVQIDPSTGTYSTSWTSLDSHVSFST